MSISLFRGFRDRSTKPLLGLLVITEMLQSQSNIHHDAHRMQIVAQFSLAIDGFFEELERLLMVAHRHLGPRPDSP